MATALGLWHNVVRRALKELEKRHMVLLKRRSGRSSEVRPRPTKDWRPLLNPVGVTRADPYRIQQETPTGFGRPPLLDSSHEGTPSKGTPVRERAQRLRSISKKPATERRRAELLANSDVIAVVEAWEGLHNTNGRPLGLLQAAESALGAGYTVARITQALGVLRVAKKHPERFHEKSEPRWLLDTRRACLPSAVLSVKSLDGLLAVAEEPEQPKRSYRWEGIAADV